ncbi:hypothetical protein ACFE04_028948 [Oxalis oulophora]
MPSSASSYEVGPDAKLSLLLALPNVMLTHVPLTNFGLLLDRLYAKLALVFALLLCQARPHLQSLPSNKARKTPSFPPLTKFSPFLAPPMCHLQSSTFSFEAQPPSPKFGFLQV